jgi:hypothetical protein
MSFFDEEAFRKGTVPWSARECAEVMEWYHRVVATPKDDWDLKERGFLLRDDEGKVSKFQFNMFQPMNQLGFYMAKRYKPDVMPYYLHRFILIMDFLSEHQQDLLDDDLARRGGEEFNEIRSEVLQALCILPFAETAESGEGGEWCGFDYDQVVSKAHELIRGASGSDFG